MDVASSFGSGDFGGFESHLGISEGLQLSKLGKKFLDAKFNVTLEAWKHNMRLCIQLWPKIWEWRKYSFSQSLLLQCFYIIFFRCYYDILKYNYNSFINVNGFYWQLH